MRLSPLADRLLADLEASHRALTERTSADEPEQLGFRAIHAAIAAALIGVTEEQLLQAPSPEEWSMAEVVEHVSEHDRKYVELLGQGLRHYLEHGLEHAMQLWHMRPGTDSASSGTSGVVC